ncbi:hypothetical protein, partial [Pseudomonas savastanoi]|uniref:hypothetical protein n=1 Tax=Pseudomonas savastanoi TaxID=29438 RepID=UPI00217FDC19
KEREETGQGRTALTGQISTHLSGEPRMSITTQQLLQILYHAAVAADTPQRQLPSWRFCSCLKRCNEQVRHRHQIAHCGIHRADRP